jgi:aryl-phospho-beta-D-glucosidase BglC (GH1 family)
VLRTTLVLATVGAYLSSVAASPVLTFLHADGQNIVDGRGQKIMLRGVGLGNWLLPEGYMWKFGSQSDRPRRIEKLVEDLIGPESARRFWTEYRNNYISEADVQEIARLGFNSVRPALNARLFLTETDPPQPVEEGFQLLDNLVGWCRTHGLYVVIDMHAAPGGQTGQNIDDSVDDQPGLFMQPKNQERLVRLWTEIARRYKDEPAVAGYDLLNEPLPARTGAEGKYKAQLEPLYKRITQAIRQVDSKHMITLEGADWANDWSVFTRPFDSNLVYQFHYYCWDAPAKVKSIESYLTYRRRFNRPVWVGETGERDNAIYWATTEYFESNKIGWCFWPWKKMDSGNGPLSVKRPKGWQAVSEYARGGDKPSRTTAQETLDELLKNIRLQNCVPNRTVVDALLRRAPGRIEAENFGRGGQGTSYSVKSKAASRFYRVDEPVPINAQESSRRGSAQFITLSADEWTAYDINSEGMQSGTLKARVRAKADPALAQLIIGTRKIDVNISRKDWTELDLGAVPFSPGINHLQWKLIRGEADLDWLEISALSVARTSSVTSSGENRD